MAAAGRNIKVQRYGSEFKKDKNYRVAADLTVQNVYLCEGVTVAQEGRIYE